MHDRDFLLWLHDRLTTAYHIDSRLDWMLKLKAIAQAVPATQCTANSITAVGVDAVPPHLEPPLPRRVKEEGLGL